MRHLIEIMEAEDRKLRLSEEALKGIHDSALDAQIAELETVDHDLHETIESSIHMKKVDHILTKKPVYDVVAKALEDYNRGLFSTHLVVDQGFIKTILHFMKSKYSGIDYVGHCGGYLFDLGNEESWDVLRNLQNGEMIAVYARDNKDFRLSNSAIDSIGGLLGNEVGIPYIESPETGEGIYVGTDSFVERLVSRVYKINLKFPEPLRFTEKMATEISKRASSPYSNPFENDQINNSGTVYLLAQLHGNGTQQVNAKSLADTCQLSGADISELTFTFRGGYPRETSYSILRCLDIIPPEEKPNLKHYNECAGRGAKTGAEEGEKTPVLEPAK